MYGSWVGATARRISRAVRRGDATATAVTVEHLDHARRADRALDAIRVLRDGVAIAEAELVDDQPELSHLIMAGVPVLVQENTPVAGLPTWHGSAGARTGISCEDHELVRRLRGAGAIVIGVTRMSELGLWPTTDDASGATRNPWCGHRSPGGPAGGSAAAVAAGVVPVAVGFDTVGSVTVPAACCGLVGLQVGGAAAGRTGILATTAADAALALTAIAGRAPMPAPPPGRLRIAVARGGAAAARLLVAAGHDAVAATPPIRTGLRGTGTWLAGAAQSAASAGGPARGDLQPRTRRLAAAAPLLAGLARADDERRRAQEWFARGFDVLVAPALAGPPPPARLWSARSWPANLAAAVRFAPAPGGLGLPTLALPLGVRPDGLPGSVALVGPPGSELLLLAVAVQLEEAAPARRRHAPGWPRSLDRATASRTTGSANAAPTRDRATIAS